MFVIAYVYRALYIHMDQCLESMKMKMIATRLMTVTRLKKGSRYMARIMNDCQSLRILYGPSQAQAKEDSLLTYRLLKAKKFIM